MKDLYTFDWTETTAKQTYSTVRKAYSAFFDELKLPYLVARAHSGAMGGNLSHEYHLESTKGEDNVVNCGECGYVVNEELFERDDEVPKPVTEISSSSLLSSSKFFQSKLSSDPTFRRHFFLTKDHKTLIQTIVPVSSDGANEPRTNPKLMKELYSVDTSIQNPELLFRDAVAARSKVSDTTEDLKIIYVFDKSISCNEFKTESIEVADKPIRAEVHRPGLNLLMIMEGDKCPNKRCSSGRLHIRRCIELGHTFHLGTRYSEALDARVSGPSAHLQSENRKSQSVEPVEKGLPEKATVKMAMQMGCHGIGISRLIAAVANVNKDKKGLNWPRAMAPFEAVIVPALGRETQAGEVYDLLSDGPNAVDCIIDDRDHGFGYKMRDAELIGYPIIIRVGKAWDEEPRKCLVQCRWPIRYEHDVPLKDLKREVLAILDQL